MTLGSAGMPVSLRWMQPVDAVTPNAPQKEDQGFSEVPFFTRAKNVSRKQRDVSAELRTGWRAHGKNLMDDMG
ncbi:hypothetical protein Ga0100231_003045 [Opitutaceae bacterium TAV4]|nr:hypothetical protein Ga0100231_003045 [Opitutaceae bacterium TAV4]RRK01898.1 hypothetical protein Ga0100230_001190 [Opitutaceae bacterium TAV3]